MQVNWLTPENEVAGISQHFFAVDASPVTITYQVEAPLNAARGTVFVVPGEAGHAVRYTEMSAAQIDPLQNFTDYRFLGLPGPQAATVAVVVLVGVLLIAAAARRWRIELAELIGANEPRLRIAFVALAVLICVLMVFRMEPFYERNYDAQYHQALVDVTFRWSDPSLDFGGNPLSSFGIQAPLNPTLIPSFLIGQLFDPDIRIPTEAAVQAVLLLLLAAYAIRASGAGVAEAFAIGLIAMALFWVPPLTSGAVPFNATLGLVWSESALVTFLALICFVRIGTGSLRSTLAWSAALLATIVWHVIALPYNLPFFVLATALTCGAAAFASTGLREFMTKGLASVAVIAVLVAMRVPQFAIDLFYYTPQTTFDVLARVYDGRVWPLKLSSLVTMAFIAPERTVGIVAFLSLVAVGATAALRRGNLIGRRFAFAGLGLSIGVTIIGFANGAIGLLPLTFFYVEQTGIAISTLLAGVGVWVILRSSAFAVTPLVPGLRRSRRAVVVPGQATRQRMWRLGLPFGMVLAGGILILLWPMPTLDLSWPPRAESEPAQLQTRALAVEPGEPFRGRSLSLMGTAAEGPLKWSTFYASLYAYLLKFGTDFMVDARYQNVPVANEYGHWISPPALALFTAAFYDGGDFIDRAAQAPRVFRPNLARLLGVALLVSDAPIAGEAPQYMGRAGGHALYLTPVVGTNLGQYSPTQVVVASTAEDILDALAAPDFDGSALAVVERPLGQTLVQASNVAVQLDKGPVVRVTAASAGVSLLVLPFDWSHCLTVTGRGVVGLVPVNLGQTGLLIEGEASAEMRYRFGLFAGTDCRRKDRERVEVLGLDDAASGRLFAANPIAAGR